MKWVATTESSLEISHLTCRKTLRRFPFPQAKHFLMELGDGRKQSYLSSGTEQSYLSSQLSVDPGAVRGEP